MDSPQSEPRTGAPSAGEQGGPPEKGSGEAAPSRAPEGERDGDELSRIRAERDEYLDLAQRTRADFENYRRRAAGEASAAEARGVARLAGALFPALDNLERALRAEGVEPGGDPPTEGLAGGVALVHAELLSALTSCGLEPVDPRGERFDPRLHEAVSSVPYEDAESGTIVEVLERGYTLGERTVRPARVIVAA